nr:GNAT family N-acetyltransferase [Oryzisolibacter propanilivorax]
MTRHCSLGLETDRAGFQRIALSSHTASVEHSHSLACPDPTSPRTAMRHYTVSDHPQQGRFEARSDDGVLAGFADYRCTGGTLTLPHTVVQPAFEGRGVGSQLARHAFDTARREGLRVEPVCSFMARWAERHPEVQDLLQRA